MHVGLVAFVVLLPCTLFANVWDELLAQGQLRPADVTFSPLTLSQVGVTNLPTPSHQLIHSAPLQIPFFIELYRDFLLKRRDKPADILISSLQKVGLAVRRNLGDQDPTEARWTESQKDGAFLRTLAELHQLAKKPFTSTQQKAMAQKAKAADPAFLRLGTYILMVSVDAIKMREQALTDTDPQFREKAFADRTAVPNTQGEDFQAGASPILRKMITRIDLKMLMVGGIDLTLALTRVKKELAQLTIQKPTRLQLETPWGVVILNSEKKSDRYEFTAQPVLLLIDLFGDDTYMDAGGTRDSRHPVSILIDADGNDSYIADAKMLSAAMDTRADRRTLPVRPAFGAGILGYGFLLDLKGRDLYRATRQVFGRASFGIGLLWDLEGNDEFDCWMQCQGSAEFGAGILISGGGEDHFQTFQQGQGFAGPLGSGLLLKLGTEGDRYLGYATPLDFPSGVDPKFNTHFVQGAVWGLRSDTTDGYSMSAGFAALVDEGGDNTFDAGFYAQGTSYWFGVGILSSGTGQDQYRSIKYTQGAGVHFGVGILHDRGGDDSYQVAQELGLGHGHDYGVGFVMDETGNDTYQGANFSMGCASAQGIGVFWDKAGDDTYISKDKEILGCGSIRIELPSIRMLSKTLGLFLDEGGRNQFKTPHGPKVDSQGRGRWQAPFPWLADDPVWPEHKQNILGLGRAGN